jgi:hypothetical protein
MICGSYSLGFAGPHKSKAVDARQQTLTFSTWMKYERLREPLASWDRFVRRLVNHFGIVVVLIAVSLGIGIGGYRYFQGMEWIDAFLNAAMLLGGMGPIETKLTWGAKLFAGLYALYAGMMVLVAASILIAPVFHRFLHRLHLDEDESAESPE